MRTVLLLILITVLGVLLTAGSLWVRGGTENLDISILIGSAVLSLFASSLSLWVGRSTYRKSIRAIYEQLKNFSTSSTPLSFQEVNVGGERELHLLLTELRQASSAHQETQSQIASLQEEVLQFEANGQWYDSYASISTSTNGESAQPRSGQHMIGRLTQELHWQTMTPPLEELFGQSIESLQGKPIFEVVHPADAEQLHSVLSSTFKEGEIHNVQFRVKSKAGIDSNGAERHLQMDAFAYLDRKGQPTQLRCHFVDVTDRVVAEKQLRRRTAELIQVNERLRTINRDLERLKESYRDLYHHAPVMYFSINRLGRIVATNETFLRVLGHQREDLLNRHYTRLLTPEGKEQWDLNPDLLHVSGEFETQWVRQDGKVIDVWIGNNIVLDEDGRFYRSRSAALDVTEKNQLARQVEERARALARVNTQLRRINQELEDFTYVVSHDLKEPLRTLEAFSNFLKIDCGDDLSAEGQDHIEHLIGASQRLGQLINDLLTLSRAGRVIGDPQPLDWDLIQETVLADLQDLLANRSRAQVTIKNPLPPVQGDTERIIQLITNLISNALKYNNSSVPEVIIGSQPTMQESGHFETFFVKDNGIGIEPQFHEEIFRIFRRLHHREEYAGTGAGLAICKKIVEAHGGRIWVESEHGVGSTFYFTLPGRLH